MIFIIMNKKIKDEFIALNEGVAANLKNRKIRELSDNPKQLETAIPILLNKSNVPIIYDVNLIIKGRNTKNLICGRYDIKEKIIYLNPSMSSLQTFKTLIHEKAHSLLIIGERREQLLQYIRQQNDNLKQEMDKEEVLAESTAFIVCNYLGFDTSSYSFGYIASYIENLQQLEDCSEIIKNTSKKLLKWIIDSTDLL